MLRNKVAIVTGASSGIGHTIAVHFAKEGAEGLVIHGRNADGLKKTHADITATGATTKVIEVLGDVTQEDTLQKIVKAAVDNFGKIDILVNNAGIQVPGSITESPMESLDNQYNVNVRAVIALTKLAIPQLIQSKGNVVNISSALAKKPIPGAVGFYAISKAALDHFTKCLALELGSKGVRVNSVNPGYVPDTPFHLRAGVPAQVLEHMNKGMGKFHALGRSTAVEDVAKAVAWVSSDLASFTTASNIMCDGGFHLMTPMQ